MNKVFDLNDYVAYGNASYYKGIPIQYLDITKKILKAHGCKYKMRYRGPRNTSIGDTRHKYEKQSNCLKRFATTFAVYGL